MAEIVEIYTRAVHQSLEPLYANWEPTLPVQLGDFGPVRNDRLVHLGNIGSLGIVFATRSSALKDQKTFGSKGTTEVKFNAKGTIPVEGVVPKASLEVAFSSEEAVFFNAAECNYTMIEDKILLGRGVMERFEAGAWRREWAIVTNLVHSGSTTLAVSGGKSASIVFEATAEVPQIDLANASIGLSVKSSRNVSYQVTAQQGLAPLIGLCKIQSKFLWWGENFDPMARSMNRGAPDAMMDSDLVRTEESKEALFFGQLR
jgi:hypothetical protein